MLFKKLDLFPYNPQLSVENEDMGHKTKLGASLTVLLGILTVLAVYAFGNEIFYKKNPTSVQSEYFMETPMLSEKELFLTFSIGKSGGIAIPNLDKILTMKWGYIDVNPNSELKDPINYDFFPVNRCVDSNSYFKDTENNKNLQNFLIQSNEEHYCMDDQLTNYKIRGEYGSSNFLSLDLRFFKCENTTENGNRCATDDEIYKEFEDMFIFFYFSNIIINPLSLNDPIQDTYSSFVTPLSLTLITQNTIKFQLVEFESDEAFLLENPKTANSFAFNQKVTDYKISETNQFYRGLISLSNHNKRITRSYIKIQKVAADVGGTISFCYHVLRMMVRFISKISFIKYFQKFLYDELEDYEREDYRFKNLKLEKPIHNTYYESFKLLSQQKLPILRPKYQVSKEIEKKDVFVYSVEQNSTNNYNQIKNESSNYVPEKLSGMGGNLLIINKNITGKKEETKNQTNLINENTFPIKKLESIEKKERLRHNYPNDLQRLAFNRSIFISDSYFIKDLIDFYFLKNANNKILRNIDSYFATEYSMENTFSNNSKISLLERFYNEESQESEFNSFLFNISNNMNLLMKSDKWKYQEKKDLLSNKSNNSKVIKSNLAQK